MGVPVHAGKWSTVQREEQNPFRTCRMPDTMQDQMSQLRAEEEVDQVSGRLTSLSAMGEESSGSLGQVSGSLGQKSAEMGDRCVPQRGSRSSIGSRRCASVCADDAFTNGCSANILAVAGFTETRALRKTLLTGKRVLWADGERRWKQRRDSRGQRQHRRWLCALKTQ